VPTTGVYADLDFEALQPLEGQPPPAPAAPTRVLPVDLTVQRRCQGLLGTKAMQKMGVLLGQVCA